MRWGRGKEAPRNWHIARSQRIWVAIACQLTVVPDIADPGGFTDIGVKPTSARMASSNRLTATSTTVATRMYSAFHSAFGRSDSVGPGLKPDLHCRSRQGTGEVIQRRARSWELDEQVELLPRFLDAGREYRVVRRLKPCVLKAPVRFRAVRLDPF